MKKQLSLVIALGMVLSMAACGSTKASSSSSSTAGSAESTAASDETVDLVLWTFADLHTQFFGKNLENYNKQTKGPKLKIDMQVYPYEDMHNKLTIALQSGEGAPDIADIEISKFANYLNGDIQLAPLNDIVEPLKDHLVMSRFENYAKDGNYYGIDHHVGATVTYYNTEILDSAGVDYKTIKTWDDYAAAGKTVVEKTGKPMTTWETTDWWSIYSLVSEHGGDWLAPDNKVRMDEPVVINTLQYIQDTVLKDKIAIACPGGNHHADEYFGWMDKGGAASVTMPFWYAARFINYMPDLKGKIKVAPMPTWSDGGHKTAQMGGTGTAVIKTGEHVDLCKDFLKYAKLSPEGNILSWQILGNDPILKDVYTSPEIKAPNQFYDYFGDDIFDVVSSVLDDVPNTCLTSSFPAAGDIVKGTMGYDLVVGEKDPAQVAKDCAEALRTEIG